jgi:hypothetical protein
MGSAMISLELNLPVLKPTEHHTYNLEAFVGREKEWKISMGHLRAAVFCLHGKLHGPAGAGIA